MITFFCSAKPFRGRTAIQQRNAINSWLRLGPEVEVMIFGTDEGVAEICEEYRLVSVPDVACTEFGTPLLSDMYERAQKYGRFPLTCYINADIILLEDFATAMELLVKRQTSFVMTGRRIDVDFCRELDFETNWRAEVRAAVAERGVPGAPVCLDYFLFRRGAIPSMPSFAIGRPAWDNWLIMDVRRRGVDLIDASRIVSPIHQNHDYGHVPLAKGIAWEGPEADRNRNLALLDAPTFRPHLHSIYSASSVLTSWGVLPACGPRHISWRIYVLLEYRNYRGRLLAAYYGMKLARFRAAAVMQARTRMVGQRLGRVVAAYRRLCSNDPAIRDRGDRGVEDGTPTRRSAHRKDMRRAFLLGDKFEAEGYAPQTSAVLNRIAASFPQKCRAGSRGDNPTLMRRLEPSRQVRLRTEQEIVDEVRRLRVAGEYATAKELCLDFLVSNPGAAAVLLELAGVQRARGELPAARRAVERSLAVDSWNLDAHLLQAELNLWISRDPSAEYYAILHRFGILNYEDSVVSGESNFLRAYLSRRSSPVVFDVGAFEGTYALDVLDKCPSARLYAFEPNPRSYGRLEQSLSGTGAITFPFALGGRSETRELFDYSEATGSQHATLSPGIFENVHRATPVSFPVEVRRLDEVVAVLSVQSIALLKIDVEGHEFEVLQGAQQIISRGMIDIIQFEFNEMNAYSNIFLRNFMEFLPRYRFYRLLPDDLLTLDPYRPLLCEIFAFQNIICVRGGVETPILKAAASESSVAGEAFVTEAV